MNLRRQRIVKRAEKKIGKLIAAQNRLTASLESNNSQHKVVIQASHRVV